MPSKRHKGASFERQICKALSLWISAGRHEDLFWRTAMSGGRATVARKKGKSVRQSGDIGAVARAGHAFTNQWYIECKFYKKIDLDSFIVKGTGKIAKWWKVCRREAKHYKRDPMLIVHQNGWPWLVITRRDHAAHWCPPHLILWCREDVNRRCDITFFDELTKVSHKIREPKHPNEQDLVDSMHAGAGR